MNRDSKMLAEAYDDVQQSRIMPQIGEIVTKASDRRDDRRDDRKEYVVVGVVPQGIWVYPTGNVDYENTTPELMFTKELTQYNNDSPENY